MKRRPYPERLAEIKQRRFEAIKAHNSERLDYVITLKMTRYQIQRVKRKTKTVKTYGVKRVDILRKVLLNLDDEDLIRFLGFLKT